ncbi:GNAT family N-acetyltransferase [Chamaesiphon minutus]|uniref:Acetyltransferase (GNAT) family protein n=1 Tax=Chamaesiphon minutus (strain ATCC 27169 / PCC 6605) TaxID=1173020 RepID=K9UPE9_CHAP6|nr:GNAT family N-acetyltransferase [Chamaesiphon minutus]AFY96276.1 acetyltransferase (GNAT) family protein [Chamaesiphon minutus PCC 6605]
MKARIAIATSISEINNCFPVMKELRSHLEIADFVERVERQQQLFNYQLAYLQVDEIVRAVAGFRISESLAWDKFMYVDDLVSSSDNRSQGYGAELFNWLLEYARAENCQQLNLDSGVQRFAAHRFYLRQRMEISSHHFTLHL